MFSRLLTIIFLLLILSGCKTHHNGPKVEKGMVDLTEYDFDSDDPVHLDGDWKFYWKQFVVSEKQPSPQYEYLSVPSSWKSLHETNGYGTYEITLHMPRKGPEKLVLLIPHIRTASRIYLDGKLKYTTGQAGKNSESSTPYYKKFFMDLPINQTVTISIEVSNFFHRSSGLTSSFLLGSEDQIRNEFTLYALNDFFLLGGLMIMFFSQMGLYFIRLHDRSALYFALISLNLAIRNLFIENYWITYFYPDVTWDLLLRVEYVSLAAIPLFFTLFFGKVYPGLFRKSFLNGLVVYNMFTVGVFLFTPARYSNYFIPYYSVTLIIIFLIGAALLFVALKKNIIGAMETFIGFVILFFSALNDILYFTGLIYSFETTSFGVFFFILSQSLVVSRIYARAFRDMEVMSGTIMDMNTAYRRFVPQEFFNLIDKPNVTLVGLGDQTQKFMTILFCDIRSFTSISEKMSPKENFDFLNNYFKHMGPIIRKHNGFVDKFIGDSIMALFPTRAEDAIESGIEILQEVESLNLQKRFITEEKIRVGIGIHSGNLMLGTIGEEMRMDATVISDAVNLASRIEGVTKLFGSSLLVSMETLLELDNPETYHFRIIGRVKIKGKDNIVIIVEIFNGIPMEVQKKYIDTKYEFESGVSYYLMRHFDEAIDNFRKVLSVNPNDLAALHYKHQSEYVKKHGVPDNWEGVVTFELPG